MEPKKLVRLYDQKVVTGVCAGVARYFNVDVTLVRVVWSIVSIFSAGAGVLAYIAAAFLMPLQ